MKHTPPTLTPRLSAAAQMIGKCHCFADIGTDHAYLPIYLIMNGFCKKAIASDIGNGPLKRASDTALKYHQNISLRLGAGLDTLLPGEADVVAVAGMGGLLIAEILKAGMDKLGSAKKIVLQPMTAIPELREYLTENGWKITDERIAKEGDKLYVLMSVRPPKSQAIDAVESPYNELELYLGRCLINKRPMYFDELLSHSRRKLCNMVNGLKSSHSAESEAKLEYCRHLIQEIDKLK